MKRYLILALILLAFIGTVSALAAYDSNTLFLTHGNGTYNSTLIRDEVGHTVTSSGNTHINNTANWSQFGIIGLNYTQGSIFLGQGSANSYISLPYSADYNFGANSITIDWWLNQTNEGAGASADALYLRQYAGADQFVFYQDQGPPRTITLLVSTGGTTRLSYALTSFIPPPSNKPNHWALVIDRGNTTVRLYVNGTNQSFLNEATAPNGNININGPIHIGYDPSYVRPIQGYFDEFRISNNVRWSQGFTPELYEYNTLRNSSFSANTSGRVLPPRGVLFNVTFPKYPTILNWSVDGVWDNQTAPFTDAMNETALFTTNGMHIVNLTVANLTMSKLQDTSTLYISTNASIYADFNATPRWSKPNRSISFVDMSTGGGLYNWTWFFGDGPNATYPQPVPPPNTSYQRNPTKEGYQLLGNYWVNLTVKGADGLNSTNRSAYIRINMNNTFTLILRDADTFNLITTPDTVKLSQLGVDYTSSVTSAGVATFELPNGAYDVMAAAIPGEYSSNIASVTMAGTDASGTIYLTPVTSGTKTTWYSPWQVRIQIVDYNANPLPGTAVTAYYIASTLPSTSVSWLSSAFGISTSVASDMTNSSLALSGTTDDNGGLSFTMFKSIGYNLSIINATSGVNVAKILYPTDQEYRIRVPLASQIALNNTLSQMSLTSLPVYVLNSTAYNLSLVYLDTSGLTTNVRFQVLFRNGTYLLDRDEGNPGIGIVRDNFTVWSPTIGDEIIWRYNATRTGT